MLRMLDFVSSALKYCLLLTLARLVSTAFGLEFGISRQYLRLLEWLLERGQRRIERCESERGLQQQQQQQQRLPSSVGSCDSLDSGSQVCNGLRAPGLSKQGAAAERPHNLVNAAARENLRSTNENGDAGGTVHRKRRVGITFGQVNEIQDKWQGSDAEKHPDPHLHLTKQANDLQSKKRRVSTPDGPPVFLLDDDFESSEDDDEGDREAPTDIDSPLPVSPSASEQQVQQQPRAAQDATGCRAKKHEFCLMDPARYVAKGVSAFIDDEVTKRFTPEELKSWNLLTRTNAKNYQFMSRSLGLCWLLGLVIRYAILMPLRIMFTLTGFLWLISTMSLIGLLPRKLRDAPYRLCSLMAFRMLSCGITSRLKFHNRQWRAQKGDICVANHTSPIDVVLLACDNCYALVGQRHGGLLGILELALSRATNHVWFDRAESRDRKMVTQRLSEHVARKSNLPVLIFPEGTCINNSAVMRFSKGIFGLDTTASVCPVALKYDSRFGDPFWCSSKQSYLQYLLMMMSSWAIKCDVWYLAPMERLEGESSAEFANRVKSEIARQGGLEDLAWDGQLKRASVKPTWLYQQQEDYARRLKLE